jgi:hypothetical protein
LGSRTEGAGVTFINTNGMAFIGPGSEWFWSALSGVVLAVTFLAIYRQLALARSANAFAQLGALVDEWQGERLVRKRIGVLVALRDGTAPAAIPDGPAQSIANFWEKVGALARAGHIAPSLIAEGLGGAQVWWATLAPWVMKARIDDANPAFWEHFEWLAGSLVRIHPESAIDQRALDRTLEQRIATSLADLRDLEAMRGVREAPSGPTAPRTTKRTSGQTATVVAPTSR